jgi:hypothetical protein
MVLDKSGRYLKKAAAQYFTPTHGNESGGGVIASFPTNFNILYNPCCYLFSLHLKLFEPPLHSVVHFFADNAVIKGGLSELTIEIILIRGCKFFFGKFRTQFRY